MESIYDETVYLESLRARIVEIVEEMNAEGHIHPYTLSGLFMDLSIEMATPEYEWEEYDE